MGKRSCFERKEHDFYPTPYEAVAPLVPHLKGIKTFVEPCAGDGRLIHHLSKHDLHCVYACDIDPKQHWIDRQDVLMFGFSAPRADAIITNPPWDRNILHDMIRIFSDCAPTWLLFDADWSHTLQAAPFKERLRKIVSIGRISWEGNGIAGKDNCAWHLFDRAGSGTEFYMRGRS